MFSTPISASGLITLDVVLTFFASLAVALRLRTRVVKKVGIGADDVLAIVSLVTFYATVFVPVMVGTPAGTKDLSFTELPLKVLSRPASETM